VTLTLPKYSAFKFRNLRLSFEKWSQLFYLFTYSFHIWHTYTLGRHLSIHVKILTPVTLTLPKYSVFKFRNLRLSFEKWSQLFYLFTYSFYIWHTYTLGRHLSIHVKILTPVTLTWPKYSAFKFRNLRLSFEKWSQLFYCLTYSFHIWQTYTLGRHLSIHVKILTPVTLTLPKYYAFKFLNLRLSFEKRLQLFYRFTYSFHIWHTYTLGQHLSIHVIILTPVTLTLPKYSAFKFQNLRLRFEKR
jgi:heme exporter protein D